MKKKIISIFVSMLLFVTVSSVTGTANVEDINADVDPNPNGGTSGTTRAPGDILFEFDAQTTHGETGSLGVEWDGTYLWSTSRGLINPTHMFFLWDTAGNLVNQYPQPAQASSWGIRDLAFDGTYLYGGSESGFWKIDPTNGATTLMFSNIAPMSCIRALAWVPSEGMFYSGNFAQGWYKFTPDGSTITPVANPGLVGVYGMAYDNINDMIWVFDQVTSPGTDADFFEYDYQTGTLTGNSWDVPMLTGLTEMIAGGCCYATDMVSGKAVLGGMVQGTPVDTIFAMELGDTNLPPNTPSTPSGPTTGIVGTSYTYSSTTTDPEGENVAYWFDWDDTTNSGWTSFVPSGDPGSATKQWTSPGTYQVTAKAKDIGDRESGFSAPLTVVISSGPVLEIGTITGGLFKVSVPINNIGGDTATNVQWTIDLAGGAFIGGSTSGTEPSIAAAGSVTVQSGLIIGFGSTTVTVTATCDEGSSDTKSQTGFVFLIFIIVNPGGSI